MRKSLLLLAILIITAGSAQGQVGNLIWSEDFDNLDNEGSTAEPVAPTPQAPASTVNKAQQQLAENMNEYLLREGIPEHEKDKFLQFMINPGELKPEELYAMHKQLEASRSGGVAPIEAPTGEAPPAREITPPNVAPPSVAGMSGTTEDPKQMAEVDAIMRSRSVMDPNNL